MKSFTSIVSVGSDELSRLVSAASTYRDRLDGGQPIERVLENRCVANMFFEPSTRTRLSFDLAAQRLGANVITFSPETSSTVKGESLQDTVQTVAAIGADILVVRHGDDGAPQDVADWTGRPVINAGDGAHEHPTQALVDLVTMTRHFGSVDGLNVVVVGDVAHSRVAHSLGHAVTALGGEIVYAGPAEWLTSVDETVKTSSFGPVLEAADVVYLLRVQTERGGTITDDYIERFTLDATRAGRMRDEAIVMHAGPMNRGVEIEASVADSPRSKVVEQVRNGVPSRMAVFSELAGSLP